MRIHEIYGMLQEYFVTALVGVAFLVAFFYIGYYLIYRKCFKGQRRFTVGQALPVVLLAGYLLMVLGLTMFSRGESFSDGRMNLHFLSSYREAWNTFSLRAWQLLIFNILMFVPLGVLLPLCNKRFQRLAWAIGAGVVFTLFIEVTQLVTNKGIFELDDLWNNALGGLLGFCLIMTVLTLAGKTKIRRGRGKMAFLYLLPVFLVVGAFGGTFLKYNSNEMGNLSGYAYKEDLSKTEVGLDVKLSQEPGEAMVYQARIYDKDEAYQFAEQFYERLGADISDISVDAYNDNAIYRARDTEKGKDYLLWFRYYGGGYSFQSHADTATDKDKGKPSGEKEKISEEEIRAALSHFGVRIPSEVSMKEEPAGDRFLYSFQADQLIFGKEMLHGSLSCEPDDKGEIVHISNGLTTYSEYKKAPLISEGEAYEKLADGQFSLYLDEVLTTLDIVGVELGYELDTKGFYRPVYIFCGLINGESRYYIKIQAMSD